MNYALKRLTKAYKAAFEIEFDDSHKIVIMSDCHRGDGSHADGFAKNQNIAFAALSYYFDKNYIYIELGDGDELWENKKQSDIIETYGNIYWLFLKFYAQNRLFLLYGNHDMQKRYSGFAENNYAKYYDAGQKKFIPLFKDITIYASIILKQSYTGNKIFLLHGHQADFFNNSLWKFARFLVRYLWRPLEIIGINDPTSAAKNYKRKSTIEKFIMEWSKQNNQIVITGHTHRPYMPDIGQGMYFNSGSCVHPRCITAIEIEHGNIVLVKWSCKTRTDATVYIGKDILAGPIKINDYYSFGNYENENIII